MKLYFSPGSCSLAAHIILIEARIPFEKEAVNLRETPHITAKGADFTTINSKGYVPALVLHNNEVLTENAAILQYIADLVPDKQLAPSNGTLERYRLQEWLSFISSEIHKAYAPLWGQAPEEIKQQAKAKLFKWFGWLDAKLNGKDYLMNSFSIADAYLFTCLGWTKPLKLELSAYPNIQSYLERIASRPSVQQAIKEETVA